MDTFFKVQLPPNIVALVDRIESFAKREILVEVDSRPVSATSVNPDRLAANITDKSATILLRSRDVFLPHDVLHELLHIERMWVDGIPQIMPKHDNRLVRFIDGIEGALEHLIIVPREADYGFDPYPYWNETSHRNWATYPWPEMSDPWMRRKACLLGWLTVAFLVNDTVVKRHVEECLHKEGLLEEAKKFSARIREKLTSKPQAISTVLRFLKIRSSDFWLARIKVNGGTFEEVPLPPH